MCILNESWQQSDIHDWRGQKTAKLNTETKQVIFVLPFSTTLTVALYINQEIMLEYYVNIPCSVYKPEVIGETHYLT